ncbi:ABC transporter permease [Inquilinus sp. OTU3971]|uniref:ABC transporter permease n=1 Tax=Inquilinus sp. OTU3971 TaxID=3043855 RepID=UPI00313BD2C4
MRDRARSLFLSHETLLATVILILGTALSLGTDSFLTLRNLEDVVTSNAYAAILCAGLVVVLVSGNIDISFAATASVAQYLAFAFLKATGNNWAALFLSVAAVGIGCGFVNAFLTQCLRLGSIIATVATLNIFFGFLMFFSGGKYISILPDWFYGGIALFSVTDSEGFKHRFNLQIILVVVSFVSSYLVLHVSNLGKQIRAVGGNVEAARRIGLNATGIGFFVFGYMGFIASLAGVAQAQLAQTVVPSALVGTELDVLAAAILGGASLAGGRGSVLGAFLGVALLAMLHNGLVLAGVSSYWVEVFNGLVVLIAASATAMKDRQMRWMKGRTADV